MAVESKVTATPMEKTIVALMTGISALGIGYLTTIYLTIAWGVTTWFLWS